jgi:hypothetical protein
MTRIIAGDRSASAQLAAELDHGSTSRIWTPEPAPAGEPANSSAPLARALAAFEADATGEEIESVLLADDSDAALAAALVASKLLIPLAATARASDPATTNGRLIARLANSYTRPA